jgi:hypothetical protein
MDYWKKIGSRRNRIMNLVEMECIWNQNNQQINSWKIHNRGLRGNQEQINI